MLEMFSTLTTEDILFAALFSYLLMQLIKFVYYAFKFFKVKDEDDEKTIDKDIRLLERCMAIFPENTVKFGDKIFNKGMKVRIVTSQKGIIEGELVGKNKNNVLCIISEKYAIAHEISKIIDMEEVNVK